MQLNLEGQCFVVTGAAQGIGRAITQALLGEGAQVAAVDIDAAALEELDEQPGLRSYNADLGSADTAHDVCRRIESECGPVHGLVSAVGGVRGQLRQAVEEVSQAQWHALFAANVDATLWCVQALAPGMKAAGGGRIVTISSGAGLRPSLTGIHGYAAAKHALVGLTRQLALELGPHGITVNSVAPGFVLSNPSTQRQWDALGADGQRALLESIHLRRLGRAEDIADAVLFLASERAAWISGQVLSVDGGRA